MKHIFNIKAGTLSLETSEDKETIDSILAFASRENPKRHFMLINKLIGRYTPTAPKVMRHTYDQLAKKIGVGPSSYVVSFAEAATGLGAGVADSLSKHQQAEVYFHHTTRHELKKELWFTVDEAHSHAVNHMFYKPNNDLYDSIIKSKRLVIVDDEITTGRTIQILLLKIMPYLKDLEEIVIASIINLMPENNHLQELSLSIPIRYISLVEGNINLEKDPLFAPKLPSKVDSELTQSHSEEGIGRCGLRMPYNENLNAINSAQDTIVIADGEHQYIPFLLAEALEKSGVDVAFQAINRSPILECDVIENKFKIASKKSQTEHYLYNFFPKNKAVFVVSEDGYDGLRFTDEIDLHEWKC